MKASIVFRVLAAMLTIGATPPPDDVPIGVFRMWGVHPEESLRFSSHSLLIEVAATRCEQPPQNEGCRYERASNQATITVTQSGLPPFRMISDRQSSFVRVAAVRLGRDDKRAAVVVDNQWGGSAGITAVSVIEPVAGGFRLVPLKDATNHGTLIGEIADRPNDRTTDGRLGLVLEGRGFAQGSTCSACRPGPPLVLTVRDGRSVDVSADPSVRPVFARDLPLHRKVCLSSNAERNGSCSAYVADAARLGEIEQAWRVMLAHYERHPRMAAADPHRDETQSYPAGLRAFLVREGYVSQIVARALRSPDG